MLELKNLYFTVQESDGISGARRNIIDAMNFTFEKGKFYAITGPNGFPESFSFTSRRA